MSTQIRTRFAPSPTGMLHLGALRTALFKYLFAHHHQGTFILRIDDTDRERLVPGALEQIMSSLRALGLNWDEGPEKGGEYGPYSQSERLSIYKKHAEDLVKSGHLYPCWCSIERLDGLRKDAQSKHQTFKYDRHCLLHPKDLKQPHVLRFHIPNEPSVISWDDSVKGPVSFQTSDLDDFVAIKSDSWPTYHLSSIVDDYTMKISHVIRGDEWVSSTPKHLLIYSAFGWKPPVYAHLPTILGPDGKKKLSKRDGVKSVTEYISEGYLPETLINFLALLGWNEGDGTTQEIYTRKELIQKFSLERVQKSPAKFDPMRLEWMNGVYIRNLPTAELFSRSKNFLPKKAEKYPEEYTHRVLGLVQERLKFLAELPDLTSFFFEDPAIGVEQVKQLQKIESSPESTLSEISVWLSDTDFTEEVLEERLRSLAENGNHKPGKLFGIVRISITGKTAAPGLFETLTVLGKEASLRRIHRTIDVLLKNRFSSTNRA